MVEKPIICIKHHMKRLKIKKHCLSSFLSGYTAGLVKQPGVYAGQHAVNLKISDLQGEFGVYNLTVIVCDCSVTSNCQTQRKTAITAAPGALCVALASLFLLLCKKLSSFVVYGNIYKLN